MENFSVYYLINEIKGLGCGPVATPAIGTSEKRAALLYPMSTINPKALVSRP